MQKGLLGLIAYMLLNGMAGAAVQFDISSGAGFVSATDVQLPLGWSDPQFQQRAAGVTFRYRTSGRYTAICSWPLPQGGAAEESRTQPFMWEVALTNTLRFDNKQRGRIDGIQLLGFAQAAGSNESVPTVGSPCSSGGGVPGTWSSVALQVEVRTLVARFGGVDTVLPF
ncbi:MAG: hypothetical protein Q8K24_09875 [Hydrogenophaga sp.]|nr:hypothetical protein [Hydrogenophaga sp.]